MILESALEEEGRAGEGGSDGRGIFLVGAGWGMSDGRHPPHL